MAYAEKQIGLVSAESAQVFIAMIELANLDPKAICKEVELPYPITKSECDYVPKPSIILLLTTIAEKIGIQSYQKLCWQSCREQFVPTLLNKLDHEKTIKGLLISFIEQLQSNSTLIKLSIQTEREKTFLVKNKKFIDAPWFRFSEMFIICYLIELIRLTYRSDWLPSSIHIQSKGAQAFALLFANDVMNEGKSKPQVFIQQSACALHIADEVLTAPLIRKKNNNKKRHQKSPPKSFIESFKAAITPYLGEKKIPIETAAFVTGLSKRTLQRQLSKYNLTYTQALEELMLDKAKSDLASFDKTISSIGISLGYSDLPHFSRFFKRMQGSSPMQYRNKLKENNTIHTT